MERKLTVERLYSLGDYKNIKFVNELSGIPEDLARDETVIELLFINQFLSCDIAYRKYWNMIQEMASKRTEDILEALEEKRSQNLQELAKKISPNKLKELEQNVGEPLVGYTGEQED